MDIQFQESYRPVPFALSHGRCRVRASLIQCAEVRVGPLATINRELRQARKGAAVAVTSGAGVWLARADLLDDTKMPTMQS